MGHVSGGPLLGVVCGLKSEAAALGFWARDPRVAIEISGANAERAREGAERLAERGAQALMSFGLAGGLDPGLRPGAALIGAEAVDGDQSFALRADLFSLNPAIAKVRIAHAEAIVADAAAKAALREASGAAAVDMETFRVAEVAAARGLPATALRAAADPAERALPPAALTATRPDGGVDLGAVLSSLSKRPSDLPGLISLGRDAARATATLRQLGAEAIPQLLDALRYGRQVTD